MLDNLDADSTLRGSNTEYLKTRRAVAKYNSAVRDKEIDFQREENAAKHANAEADFQRQARLKEHIMYLLCPVLHGHPKVKIGRVSRASGQEPTDEVSPSNTGGLHTMILLPCDMGGLW